MLAWPVLEQKIDRDCYDPSIDLLDMPGPRCEVFSNLLLVLSRPVIQYDFNPDDPQHLALGSDWIGEPSKMGNPIQKLRCMYGPVVEH